AAKCSDHHRCRRCAYDGRQPDRDEAIAWRTAWRAFGDRRRATRTGHETWGTGDAAAEEGAGPSSARSVTNYQSNLTPNRHSRGGTIVVGCRKLVAEPQLMF